MTRHRWVWPIVLIGMGTAVLLGWLGSREQVPGRELARYDVMVDLAEDGAAQVTIDMDYAFGEQPGHGPFITLPLRQPYDDARDRVYRVSEITTSSPSGAPARHYLDETPWEVAVRVGDENRGDISGTHRYTISYRLDGILNPAAGDGTYDEWYWNVLGDGWEVPVRDVTVTVRGPADVLAAACYAGRTGATSSCGSARTAHDEARFTHPGVSPGEQLSVVVGWPAGTFPDARVRLGPRERPPLEELGFRLDPRSPAGLAAGLVLVLGVAGAIGLARSQGRDERYAGLTPGLRPADGEGTVVRSRSRPAVAVRFEPPEGLTPGLVGTLVDGKADPHDVTATIVDLAVRGHLRIEQIPPEHRTPWELDGKLAWRLVKIEDPPGGLLAYEELLLRSLFPAGQTTVRLTAARGSLGEAITSVQGLLYRELTDRGWYRRSPEQERQVWSGAGFVVALAAVVVGVLVGAMVSARGVILPWVALLLVGLVVARAGRLAPARTADGSAVLAQTLGFREFIATAEARQLRFEEARDLFSAYLPYAIAFGEAERWAELFSRLPDGSTSSTDLTWISGASVAGLGSAGFAASLASFTTATSTTVSVATSGSSGGSGFSGGGGGSAGGGGGGGGGGGW